MSSDENTHLRLQRIENLRAKLRARSGSTLYAENCEAIKLQIENLEKAHALEMSYASQENEDGAENS
jgi:hypothetical protein